MRDREGWAHLRGYGVYSSQISEWRKLRDAGMLQGKKFRREDLPSQRRANDISQLKRGPGTDVLETYVDHYNVGRSHQGHGSGSCADHYFALASAVLASLKNALTPSPMESLPKPTASALRLNDVLMSW